MLFEEEWLSKTIHVFLGVGLIREALSILFIIISLGHEDNKLATREFDVI